MANVTAKTPNILLALEIMLNQEPHELYSHLGVCDLHWVDQQLAQYPLWVFRQGADNLKRYMFPLVAECLEELYDNNQS